MIASNSLNFIFLKTRKTGSTSVEIVLSSWCSGTDICTRLTAADEALRAQYGGSARNAEGQDDTARFYNHMPAAEVRALLPDLWSSAYRFAIDRHPYEKVVSQAWWRVGRQKLDPDTSLATAIDDIVASGSYLNFPLYTVDGALALDEVIPYEQMWQHISALARRLGTPMPSSVPSAKAHFRKDRRPAVEVLNAAQKSRIREDAGFEFDLLGYRP